MATLSRVTWFFFPDGYFIHLNEYSLVSREKRFLFYHMIFFTFFCFYSLFSFSTFFFFFFCFYFYSTLHGGKPTACARSMLVWPNSFYPENVFRVTLPRKSKFDGLNWVLFHALRSLDCPRCSNRDFCCSRLYTTFYHANRPFPLLLSLEKHHSNSRFPARSLPPFGQAHAFLLYFWSFLPSLLLIKITGRYDLRRAMQWEVRSTRFKYNGCV